MRSVGRDNVRLGLAGSRAHGRLQVGVWASSAWLPWKADTRSCSSKLTLSHEMEEVAEGGFGAHERAVSFAAWLHSAHNASVSVAAAYS